MEDLVAADAANLGLDQGTVIPRRRRWAGAASLAFAAAADSEVVDDIVVARDRAMDWAVANRAQTIESFRDAV